VDNVPRLIYKLKMVYIRLYSTNDYLMDFDRTLRYTINNHAKDKVFKINDKYINMPNSNKPELFPDVYKIVNIYKDNIKIENLSKSSYLLV